MKNTSEKLVIVLGDVFKDLFGENGAKTILSYIEIETKNTRLRVNRDVIFDDPARFNKLLRGLFGDVAHKLIEKRILKVLSERFDVDFDKKRDLNDFIQKIKKLNKVG